MVPGVREKPVPVYGVYGAVAKEYPFDRFRNDFLDVQVDVSPSREGFRGGAPLRRNLVFVFHSSSSLKL